MTPNQLKIFNQCVEAIDAGRNIHIVGDRRGIIRRALMEHYKLPEWATHVEINRSSLKGIDPSNWLQGHFKIKDETVPYDWENWTDEQREQYKEAIKQFMKPITDKLPQIGFPLIITSCESDTDHFKDLFTKAE